jgi:hypothetical protein
LLAPEYDGGDVYVLSGKNHCAVSPDLVTCEYQQDSRQGPPGSSLNCAPPPGIPSKCTPGARWVQVDVDPTGTFHRSDEDGPALQPGEEQRLNDDQPYKALGWTIAPGRDGIRLTNDGSGKGLFVGRDIAHPF